jgi:hypothetical protein
MEYVFAGLAILIVVVAVARWRLRGRLRRGPRCWQCGFDLTGCAARIDSRGDRRCPKCGELIEADEPGGTDHL